MSLLMLVLPNGCSLGSASRAVDGTIGPLGYKNRMLWFNYSTEINHHETIMKQSGLDHRHRDKNGEIARKHGNTLISTLRQAYGQHFGPGIKGHKKLEDVLHILDEPSLSQLIEDRR